jgi:hypothetical protein
MSVLTLFFRSSLMNRHGSLLHHLTEVAPRVVSLEAPRNAKCYVALLADCIHCFPLTTRRTHTTPPSCRTSHRPVTTVGRFSTTSFRWMCSRSNYAPLGVTLNPSSMIHQATHKGETKVSMQQFPATGWQQDETVQNCQIQEMEKEFICPFPGPTTDAITVCHPVCFVNISHVRVVVSNNCWLDCISMLITEIAFCWRIVHVCQHVNVTFVLPNYCCHVTPHPSPYVSFLQSKLSSSKIIRQAPSILSDCPTARYVLCLQFVKQVWWRKKIVHVQFVTYAPNTPA